MSFSKAKTFDSQPDSSLISDRDLAEYYGVSRTTIWRWTKLGHLPKPYRLGSKTTRWKIGEIRAAAQRMA